MPDPRRIQPEELSKAVAKAVQLAKSKHKLDLQPHLFQQDFARIPWWIVGRILREEVELDQAHKVSETITSAVDGKLGSFQPATIRIGHDILVGFIERFGNQVDLPDLLSGAGSSGL